MADHKTRLTLIFSLIAAIVILIIGVLMLSGHAQKEMIGFEIVKLLVQFLLVGVLGVVISLLVQNYNRQRDKEVTINDLRKTVLTSLIRAYSDTKRARRIIMGSRLSEEKILFKVYDEQLKNIIDTQLSLEILNHQILTSQSYFGKNVQSEIIDNVGSMEKYLGDVIDEYKDAMRNSAKEPDYVNLKDLPKLNSIMGKEKEGENFRKLFVTPYKSAVVAIRREILN